MSAAPVPPAAEVVSILAIFREVAIERLAKLAKRASRYGQSITWTETPRSITRKRARWDGKVEEVTEERLDLAIVGTAPRVGDFRFLASLERTPGGVLISGVPGVEIGELGSDWDGRCDHCHSNRARSFGFVVEGPEGRKIVGKSCLRDHLGTDTPAGIVAIFQYFRDALGGEDEDGESWGRGGRWEEETLGVVAAARAAIALWGWRPKSVEGMTTANYVGLLTARLDPKKDREAYQDRQRLRAELRDRGDHYQDTAEAVIAWGTALEPRSDYERNLKVALNCQTVAGKRFGLVVSAAAAYDRQVAVEEQRKAERAARPVSRWVGTVGAKVTATVTVERIVGLPDYGYGPSSLYILRGDDGALVSWKTQSDVWIGDKRAEVGDRAEATFTVKAHTTYQEQQETRATRTRLKASGAVK